MPAGWKPAPRLDQSTGREALANSAARISSRHRCARVFRATRIDLNAAAVFHAVEGTTARPPGINPGSRRFSEQSRRHQAAYRLCDKRELTGDDLATFRKLPPSGCGRPRNEQRRAMREITYTEQIHPSLHLHGTFFTASLPLRGELQCCLRGNFFFICGQKIRGCRHWSERSTSLEISTRLKEMLQRISANFYGNLATDKFEMKSSEKINIDDENKVENTRL